MAITNIAKPTEISPAFNPLWYIADSTNQNEPGFRYIFDVYEAGTTNKIAERKVSPEVVNGYGKQNLSKLLQGFVSHDFDPTNSTCFDASKSYYQYDVKVGEEYIVSIDYSNTLLQNVNFVKIITTHSFVVGDAVVIDQADGGVANPSLQGLFVVVAVNGTTDFTVNSLWSEITNPTINGSVNYADNRKTIFRDLQALRNKFVYNGAFTFQGWTQYDETDYHLTGNDSKLLTDLPDDFTITPFQDIFVNCLTQTETIYHMEFVNSAGTVYRKPIDSGGFIDQVMVSGADLQASLTLVSGTGDLVTDSITSYDFYVVDDVFLPLSQTYTLHLDRRCAINDYVVAFLDRKGSMLSYAFQLHDQLNGAVKRTEFQQELVGEVNQFQWGYDTLERGGKHLNISAVETLTLRTNHIKRQSELNLFKQLITSPEVYLQTNGVWYSAEIADKSYNVPRLRQKRLQRMEIKIRIANTDPING